MTPQQLNKATELYNSMRPYSDEELPDALQQIVNDPVFPVPAAFLYPDLNLQQVRDHFLSFHTIVDFQATIMRHAINRILSTSKSSLHSRISPKFDKAQHYLFISNHRDIVLDAMLLQQVLYEHGAQTSQIIFGNNLLSIPFMSVAGRVNKMVGIDRGGSPKEFYQCLNRTSHYIREAIVEQHESVWIAQGNGRTKNGLDTTDPAVVKMLSMSSESPMAESFLALHPLPISISYEWESCDMFKAIELTRSLHGKYQKDADEDYKSVVTGLFSDKGRIHINIGAPITADELTQCDNRAQRIAELLDDRIVAGYHLFPSNYVAADLRNHNRDYSAYYSSSDQDAFMARLAELEQRVSLPSMNFSEDDRIMARHFFIDIYANPVSNAQRHGEI